MDIGEDEKRKIIRIEPLPETEPVREPSPEPVSVPEREPEKVPG